MSDTKQFTLTAEEAQFLFERASRSHLPQELGDEKFDVATQSISNDEMGKLFDNLKGYSPWAQSWGKDRLMLFGDKNDWLVILEKEIVRNAEHLTPNKEYKINLSNSAINGAMWILFLSLYPSVKLNQKEGPQNTAPISNSVAVQICWPIAKKLGKTKALQTYLKIDKNKSRTWADDE